jgi:hypothetical protein
MPTFILFFNLAKNVMLSLVTYKPSLYRAYQNDIFNYLVTPVELDIPTDPQEYLERLMLVRTFKLKFIL